MTDEELAAMEHLARRGYGGVTRIRRLLAEIKRLQTRVAVLEASITEARGILAACREAIGATT